MTQGVGNEPEGDSLKGNRRGWFVAVIPSFLLRTSKMNHFGIPERQGIP